MRRRPAGVEPRRRESLAQVLPLEIDRREGQRVRLRDYGLGQPPPLPLLGIGVIDFEDVQSRVRIAIGEGIEARAKHHQLPDTFGDRIGDRIFGKARPDGDEQPHRPLGRIIAGVQRDRFGCFPEHRNCQRIAEHQAAFQDLVSRAMCRSGAGRQAGLSNLHAAGTIGRGVGQVQARQESRTDGRGPV